MPNATMIRTVNSLFGIATILFGLWCLLFAFSMIGMIDPDLEDRAWWGEYFRRIAEGGFLGIGFGLAIVSLGAHIIRHRQGPVEEITDPGKKRIGHDRDDI